MKVSDIPQNIVKPPTPDNWKNAARYGGTDRIRAAYRDNYDRLVTVKNRYDPRNLFHFNQNIKPTT